MAGPPRRVLLFISCVADAFAPRIGESVVRVLRYLGLEVDFPRGQTCCGQPAFNAGYWDEAAAVARQLVRALAGSEYVVTPSGSCAAMIRHHYPALLGPEGQALAGRVYEFSEFLVDLLGVEDLGARLSATATYHVSCHMTRLLGVHEQPLRLLRSVRDLQLVDLPHAEECCGFGGTFSVKLPEISTAMATSKANNVLQTGAQILVGSDLACLMNIGGRLRRMGRDLQVMHVAEVLDAGLRQAAADAASDAGEVAERSAGAAHSASHDAAAS